MGEIKKIKNVVINNVVPLNNGDVALFLSLYYALIEKGYTVKIAAYHIREAKQAYPNLPLFPELCQGFLFRKLPFLKKYILPFSFRFNKAYRNADLIIGAPGGYINSYYSIKSSLSIFKIAKRNNKKTAIYSQSVGPLNGQDSLLFTSIMKNAIDFILVRDQFSKDTMERLEINKSKYKLTKDAAFLLGFEATPIPNKKKIAFSVREWRDDNRDVTAFKSMIKEMVISAIDNGYSVDFLSTCQGIESYKNDAIIAAEIYNELPHSYQKKSNVLSDYYNFHAFYKKLEEYQMVVGTRLHMCITALTKGIPALNISYEIKGKECYNYLDLLDYSIDYNENLDSALNCLDNFVKNQEIIRAHLETVIPETNKIVQKDFNSFLQHLNEL